ncbi:unnamed protein product [Arctogadus glacialis]
MRPWAGSWRWITLVLLAWGTLLFYIGGHLVRDSEHPERSSRELSKILAKLERLKQQNEDLRRMAESLRATRAVGGAPPGARSTDTHSHTQGHRCAVFSVKGTPAGTACFLFTAVTVLYVCPSLMPPSPSVRLPVGISVLDQEPPLLPGYCRPCSSLFINPPQHQLGLSLSSALPSSSLKLLHSQEKILSYSSLYPARPTRSPCRSPSDPLLRSAPVGRVVVPSLRLLLSISPQGRVPLASAARRAPSPTRVRIPESQAEAGSLAAAGRLRSLEDQLTRAKQKIHSFSTRLVGDDNTELGRIRVHVRRTDKVGTEAAFHPIEEYMAHVEEQFQLLARRMHVDKKRVYLATDDPSLLQEAKTKYPDYHFISDNSISWSAGLHNRYTENSLRGVILDIHFLSQTDFLVCTFSSQVCRVAYEMMQTLHPDASSYFYSLDDIYYFGGQNAHNQVAIHAHQPRNSEDIPLEPGDLVGVAGNHWDGYSKGVNRKLGRTGLYPSYKVKEKVETVKYPTYPEADKQLSAQSNNNNNNSKK